MVSIGGGQVTYSINQFVGLLVFQSVSFLPASIAITVAALAIVALAALNLFAQGRQLFDNIFRPVRAGAGISVRAMRYLGLGKGFRMRGLFEPRKLLAMFILCALVMVAIGAMGGPDPRLKAYVIAGNQATANQVQKELQQINDNVLVLTPSQDFTDFNVMSSVGQFNLVVFANYTEPQIQQVGPFVLGNLGNVPVIVVDNTNLTITQSIETLYPDSFLNVATRAEHDSFTDDRTDPPALTQSAKQHPRATY